MGAHGNSFGIFGPSMGLLEARRGWKMIVKHMASSSLNMSSYRAIWTHFRSNFIIVSICPRSRNMTFFLNDKFLLLATLMFLGHKQKQPRSQQVNTEEPEMSQSGYISKLNVSHVVAP